MAAGFRGQQGKHHRSYEYPLLGTHTSTVAVFAAESALAGDTAVAAGPAYPVLVAAFCSRAHREVGAAQPAATGDDQTCCARCAEQRSTEAAKGSREVCQIILENAELGTCAFIKTAYIRGKQPRRHSSDGASISVCVRN